MPEIALAKALSSNLSWKILDLLMHESMQEDKTIAKSLGVPLRIARGQLGRLVEAGLVAVREKTSSRSKASLYYLSGEAKFLQYPPRGYQHLSEALITNLVESLGQNGARMILKDIGTRIGEDIGRNLISIASSTVWDPQMYADLYVNRFLRQMGTYPALRNIEEGKLVYEQSNCLFQELADKMPGLICDILDEAVHEGVDKALGVTTSRSACKGHGDPSCVFCVTWQKEQSGEKNSSER